METQTAVPKNKSKRWIIWTILIILVAFPGAILAARLAANGKEPAVISQERLQPVEIVLAANRQISEEVSVAGTVSPNQEVTLAPKVMGRIDAAYTGIGQLVKKGQVLLSIEKGDYITAVRAAEASLAMARANSIQAETGYRNAMLNYDRMEVLFKEGAIPQSQLEAAKGQLAAAESGYKANQAQIMQAEVGLDRARTDLANTDITAPFSGVVAKVFADTGGMVSPQTPVITLIQNEPLLVKVNLPENVVAQITPGQKVDVFVSSTARLYKGTVKAVAPQADQMTRAFACEIMLEGVGGEVKPGMVADLRIKTRQVEDALVVPTEALLDEEKGSGIFVVENGIARYLKVQTGISAQGYTQVTQGLKSGDQVVVRGNHLLVEGMKVRVSAGAEDSKTGAGGESR